MRKTSYEVLLGFVIGVAIAIAADWLAPPSWDRVTFAVWIIGTCSLLGLAWNACERWDPR